MPFLLAMFNAESLIHYGGLLLVFLAVYGQTGLFFAFFIPSGALLFTTGVFVATGDMQENFFGVAGILSLAAILGNSTGYALGWKAGPLMYRRQASRFFKQQHLEKAKAFYDSYGDVALAVGLFLPIIRTFSPIVAGILKLSFRRYLFFTSLGSVCWISSFLAAGYLVGTMPFLRPYLKYIIIGIIIIVTLPVVVSIIRRLNRGGRGMGRGGG